ncbi:MAG: bifunctional phosphoribosylaminoimidazolecarboxamide formyltransferase/IMP cyclohydrolase [Bacteroidota bacterium]|nr:bifunctional phosphoribosylaminoimidazolecarboxamide formyltransferase/IMP cyclohydrolase [Bacteroidota bacterium]
MSDNVKINRALISVYYKDGLEPIVKKLHELGVEICSTGGTQTFVEAMGIPVTPVESLTGYPSILGGRVKTLHPGVFGGILGRRENESDVQEMEQLHIKPIDLIIVDLYPFEETVACCSTEADIIEKIDIGGVSLIRAAAKNFQHTVIISSKNDYDYLLEILNRQDGSSTTAERKELAKRAFYTTNHYDGAIFKYFNQEPLAYFSESYNNPTPLRYGENPHQQAAFFGNINDIFEQIQGKEISYNNIVDAEAAVELLAEFAEPACVIIKHTNPCGTAVRATALEAWQAALAGDPVSAFGGIIAINREVDAALAKEIDKIFFEILIAPSFSAEAMEIFASKKNRTLLKLKDFERGNWQYKSVLNGVLVQQKDNKQEQETELNYITNTKPSAAQIEDLLFANRLVKNAKSNTIILAKDKQLLGLGCGMTSRIDALKHALNKAAEFGMDLNGAVMASDAFFPFPDCVELAHQYGIAAIIQPGGSIKDQLSIDYCNKHNLPMVITGYRHFKH